MARVKKSAGWISARFTTFEFTLIANYESPAMRTAFEFIDNRVPIYCASPPHERRNLPERRDGRKCLPRGLPRDLDLRSFADPNVNQARSAALTYYHQNDHVYIGRRQRQNSTCPAFNSDDDDDDDDDFHYILA